jgi:subtilisin family serine protease
MGHGTLVTNVAAGSEGIAPKANIGAYRVFGCKGDATDDVIIAAIERAVLDGMDIINLSVSDRSGYPEVRLPRYCAVLAFLQPAVAVMLACLLTILVTVHRYQTDLGARR